VGPWGALAIGFAAGAICFFAVNLKTRFGYDDSLDVVGVHMVGGIVGALLTGVFASLAVNPAGANGSLLQVGKQAVAVVVTLAYSFGATMMILKAVDRLVGLRVTADDEETGLDLSEHREVAYTWTEHPAFPAHLVTVPDAAPLPVQRAVAILDVMDPALD
jgi:Amt family ammonium transporter